MGLSGRARAVVEVVAVTALAHFAYKALKLAEAPGRNFAPGFVLIVAAAAMLWVHRRDFASYGILSPSWREGVSLGAATSAVIFGLWLACLYGMPEGSNTALPRSLGGLACIVAAAGAGADRRRRLARIFPPLPALLLVVAILVAIASIGTPSLVASRVLFTSVGEEAFFRGYVQSRANAAFGRPVRILGVACGPGLPISAALFGIVHLLNPTLWFHGRWEVSWSLGVITFFSGLVFGYLREMTSSIWAGVLVHGTGGACGAVR